MEEIKHFLVSSKRVISSMILFILITLSLTLVTSGHATAEGDPPTQVSISPLILTGPPGWINITDTFTINVTVSNVIDLFYWQVGLSFNPTVLQCVNFTEGPFLKAGGGTVWQPGTINNEEGLITPHGATLNMTCDEGVSGSGTLAYIAFKVKDVGLSSLHLEDVILLDSNYDKIEPVVLQHGQFNLPFPGPRPPNAYFSYYPLTPYVNETVTFDASGSTTSGKIKNYEWDFGDGSQGQGMIINHTYISPGEYNVTLTVTDNKNLTDSFSRLVTVLPLLPGASIDVYTQRDGKGLNQPSDAFAPQELVIITAYLTYNGTPVTDKPVTFRMYLPNGTMILNKTSETDDDGLAFITYSTFPSMPVFGLYSINASASVDGENVSDTLWFRVGWLVEVLEVLPCDRNGVPKNEFEKGEPLYLTVKLQNIRFHSADATLLVTVLDECLQPIIFYTEECIVPPNQTTVFLNVGAIPKEAYRGNATVRVDALKWFGGPGYCPSVRAWFMITTPIPDVAVVGVTTSPSEVYVGQSVNITVSVLNEFWKPQSFNVTIYANTTVIQTLTITNLPPYIQTNFTFIWNTYTVSSGNYTISAQASIVPCEIDTTDNTYIDNTVTILNRPPTIDSFTPTDTTPEVNEGDSLEFTHTSSDPDGNPLTYSWLLDSVEQSTTQSWTYSPDYDDDGTHNVTLVVSDGELTDSQQWIVTVSDVNGPPTIDSYYPSTNPTIKEGESQEFNIAYSDPDGDMVSVQWYLDGTPTVTNDSYTFIAVNGSAGTYNVTVIISDGFAQTSHEWLLTVTLTQPVGGIYIPVDKLSLLAPYIGLTILLAVAVVTVGYVKERKRNTKINSNKQSES